MSVAFQFVDVAVVVVVLVSAIYATYRGFVAETLSVFAWIAAAFAALYFGPWASYWLSGMTSPAWLGNVLGYAVVVLVVLLPLSFASARIADNIKKTHVGTLDGAAGAAFGVARALVLVGVAYLIFIAAVAPADRPEWVTQARLMPVIRASAEVVASLIPDQKIHRHEQVSQPPQQRQAAPQKAAKTTPQPPPKPAKPKRPGKTYGARDRHALDRLIETSGSGTSGKP